MKQYKICTYNIAKCTKFNAKLLKWRWLLLVKYVKFTAIMKTRPCDLARRLVSVSAHLYVTEITAHCAPVCIQTPRTCTYRYNVWLIVEILNSPNIYSLLKPKIVTYAYRTQIFPQLSNYESKYTLIAILGQETGHFWPNSEWSPKFFIAGYLFVWCTSARWPWSMRYTVYTYSYLRSYLLTYYVSRVSCNLEWV